MSRLEKFKKLKTHPYLGKDFKKLKESEYNECIGFLESTEGYPRDVYVIALNRWKLDEVRSKNHTVMWSLLTECAV